VSKALPMDPESRRAYYTMQRGILCGHSGPFLHTARQSRRAWHKELRAQADYEPVDVGIPEAERPKGHPTPRRKNAIEGKRAMRRHLEATRARKAAEQVPSA
jgi:iron only hydrogenase large subunit-like protein